jgi:hypothetical protein
VITWERKLERKTWYWWVDVHERSYSIFWEKDNTIWGKINDYVPKERLKPLELEDMKYAVTRWDVLFWFFLKHRSIEAQCLWVKAFAEYIDETCGFWDKYKERKKSQKLYKYIYSHNEDK